MKTLKINTMKFFLDANMPLSSVELFEEMNLPAVHARKIGLGSAGDEEIINYAIDNNFILITKDLEFGNQEIFPLKFLRGLIILRLPFYFTASQINDSLKNFFISIDIKELENNLTIIKLGRFRIKRLN